MSLQILFIDDATCSEGVAIGEWIAQNWSDSGIRCSASIEQALTAGNWIPDLIVVLQSWPDQFEASEISSLMQRAPLARWVVCYSPWCESDGRTRDVWPLAVRIPIHRAVDRLRQEWELLQGQQVTPLPMSASREEIFGADHPALQAGSPTVQVEVNSPDPEFRRYLEQVLVAAGSIVSSDDCNTVLLFDADPWGDRRRCELMQSTKPDRRVVALSSLPDPHITMQLRSLGVVEILPKLCDQNRILKAVVAASGGIAGDQ